MAQPLALAMDELHTQIGNAVSCENPSSFCCCNSFHLIDGHDESNGQAVGVYGSRQLRGTKFIYKGKLISRYGWSFLHIITSPERGQSQIHSYSPNCCLSVCLAICRFTSRA